MADAMFLGRSQLSHRSVHIRDIEDGVVAKAVCALGPKPDLAFARAIGSVDSTVALGQGDYAAKARRPLCLWHVGQ